MRIPKLVTAEESSLGKIELPTVHIKDINTQTTSELSFWVIDMQNWQSGWKLLCDIRNNQSVHIYLKPIVIIKHNNALPLDIEKSADGVINFSEISEEIFESWSSTLEPVNQWIDTLSSSESSIDKNLSYKVLRLIASRNKELKPIKTIRRSSGYVYPLLEPLFDKRDSGVMETLKLLSNQSLLTTSFITKAHFCSHCSSAFLNFKETCPHCKTDDLTVDELVHHFKCAYTAELSEFSKGDTLTCPKCEKTLRHIGVDYDKPSMVTRCNQCNHRFQDAVVVTDCYNCGRTAEPSEQENVDICSYSISAIGKNAAVFGLDALFTSLLEKELQLHSTASFKSFVQVEIARIVRYKRTSSSLAMINFVELENLYIQLGKKAKTVFAELSSIFKAVFRESDVITSQNESIFFVLLTDTDLQSAEIGVSRLENSVKELFLSNLDVEIDIKTLLKAVDNELNLNQTLEDFLSDD